MAPTCFCRPSCKHSPGGRPPTNSDLVVSPLTVATSYGGPVIPRGSHRFLRAGKQSPRAADRSLHHKCAPWPFCLFRRVIEPTDHSGRNGARHRRPCRFFSNTQFINFHEETVMVSWTILELRCGLGGSDCRHLPKIAPGMLFAQSLGAQPLTSQTRSPRSNRRSPLNHKGAVRTETSADLTRAFCRTVRQSGSPHFFFCIPKTP